MGLVQPPWVDKDFFEIAPFNFCDHFGDRKKLAKVCRICREAISEGWREFDLETIFEEEARNILDDKQELERRIEKAITFYRKVDFDILNLAEGYSVIAGGVIIDILRLPITIDKKVRYLDYDVLAHSEYYVVVKIERALSSRKREKEHPILKDSADSKTSALFAQMAVYRNARVAHNIGNDLNLSLRMRKKFLNFRKLSVGMANVIKKEFYPEYKYQIEEFGTNTYDKIFKPFKV